MELGLTEIAAGQRAPGVGTLRQNVRVLTAYANKPGMRLQCVGQFRHFTSQEVQQGGWALQWFPTDAVTPTPTTASALLRRASSPSRGGATASYARAQPLRRAAHLGPPRAAGEDRGRFTPTSTLAGTRCRPPATSSCAPRSKPSSALALPPPPLNKNKSKRARPRGAGGAGCGRHAVVQYAGGGRAERVGAGADAGGGRTPRVGRIEPGRNTAAATAAISTVRPPAASAFVGGSVRPPVGERSGAACCCLRRQFRPTTCG